MMWYVQYLQAREIVAARDAEAARARLSRLASLASEGSPIRRSSRFRRVVGSTFARVGDGAERIALALDPDALCGQHRDAVLRIDRGRIARNA